MFWNSSVNKPMTHSFCAKSNLFEMSTICKINFKNTVVFKYTCGQLATCIVKQSAYELLDLFNAVIYYCQGRVSEAASAPEIA